MLDVDPFKVGIVWKKRVRNKQKEQCLKSKVSVLKFVCEAEALTLKQARA